MENELIIAGIGLAGSIIGSGTTLLVTWLRRRHRQAVSAKLEAGAAHVISGAWAPIVAAYERQVQVLSMAVEGLRMEVNTWRQESESWRAHAEACEKQSELDRARIAAIEEHSRISDLQLKELRELLKDRPKQASSPSIAIDLDPSRTPAEGVRVDEKES